MKMGFLNKLKFSFKHLNYFQTPTVINDNGVVLNNYLFSKHPYIMLLTTIGGGGGGAPLLPP